MPDLLFELGCEELPASFVRKAYTDLAENIRSALVEQNLDCGEIECYGTPRRLIVWVPGLPDRQADQTKQIRGPGLQAAYDATGNPAPALLGFCKSNGFSPDQVERIDPYVWINKSIPGRETAEILADVLPKAVRSLTFEKSMRWGAARMRFARPIRWVLAVFDGKTVEFEIESVKSSNTSRGHRFYSPEPFVATTLTGLHNELVHRYVELHPDARRAEIVRQAKKVAEGEPDLSDALVDENTFLTEWPTALQGRFREEFLELPAPVLVTAMAKHEKMFPVRDSDGKITDKFVFVRNSGEDATVRAGAEWVLNARFNDAKFFFDEDKKRTLEEFWELSDRIVFQEKLGTVKQRSLRIAAIAKFLAEETGASPEEQEWAALAGRLSKADLSSGLVSELTSLQGVVGGEYARREGMPDPVCWAIASHYDLGKNPKPDCEGARTAVRVLMADQLDKLAGYLGIGLAPTGSSDPFALRRAATMLIEAAWGWPNRLPSLVSAFKFACQSYRDQGVVLSAENLKDSFADVVASRYLNLLPDVRHDVLEAAVLKDGPSASADPQGVRFRIACMNVLALETDLVQTATRPLNIVAAAAKKGIDFDQAATAASVDVAHLQSPEGVALLGVAEGHRALLEEAAATEDADRMVSLVRNLVDPLKSYFDSTMIMADEPTSRAARLNLAQFVSHQLLVAGDFSKVVVAEE